MNRLFALKHIATIALVLSAASASAQTITLTNVSNTSSGFFPQYDYTQYGFDPSGPFSYYNFTFGVSAGTGAGSALAGGSYMGFCVNTFLSDPANGNVYNLDTTGGVLSYSINGSPDLWSIDSGAKYAAFKDVLATYAYQLATTPKNTQQYADLVTAFSVLSTELVIDYDGTQASIDTNSGNNTVKDSLGNPLPLTGNIATIYNSMRSTAGTGVGAGFNLYAVGRQSGGTQDMLFFDVNSVPEPSSTLLVILGGSLLISRRRRAA